MGEHINRSDLNNENLKVLIDGEANFYNYLKLVKRRLEKPNSNPLLLSSYKVEPANQSRPIVSLLYYEFYNSNLDRHNILLISIDENQKITGIRNTYFFVQPSNHLLANGSIEVLPSKRGQGIATAIERVHSLVLQNKVNKEPQIEAITYKIIDANKDNLEFILEKLSVADPSKLYYQDLLSQLKDAQRQRRAWEHLYGLSNRLGFVEVNGVLLKKYVKGTKPNDFGIQKIDMEVNVFDLIDQNS